MAISKRFRCALFALCVCFYGAAVAGPSSGYVLLLADVRADQDCIVSCIDITDSKLAPSTATSIPGYVASTWSAALPKVELVASRHFSGLLRNAGTQQRVSPVNSVDLDIAEWLDDLLKVLAGCDNSVRLTPMLKVSTVSSFSRSGRILCDKSPPIVALQEGDPINKGDWDEFTAKCAQNMAASLGLADKAGAAKRSSEAFWRNELATTMSGPTLGFKLVRYMPERGTMLFKWERSDDAASATQQMATALQDILIGF